MISLFVLPFTLLVVLASSISGDRHLYEIVTLCGPPHHQDLGRARARTAGNRFACDDKELGPSWGGNYPENGLVKPPRRDTRALSPAGMFRRKVPLRLAAQKSRLHAPSAPMRSALLTFFANGEYKPD